MTSPDNSSQVITVLAVRGGCGKTTFATNLAVALRNGGRKVCLLDLDVDYGDVAGTLRLCRDRTFTDAPHGPVVPTPYVSGLDCVFTPALPDEPAPASAELVTSMLGELRTRYDHVVVDTPASLSPAVLAATEHADHRVVLAVPEITVLRRVHDVLETLGLLGLDGPPRSLVINRADRRAGLASVDVERALRERIACWVPASRDVPTSRNQGMPLALSVPKHPVSIAIRAFAEDCVLHAPNPGVLARF